MTKIGRKLFGTPIIWRDWDDDLLEGSVQYWELFTDLIMVAAATAIADSLKENPTLDGYLWFALYYMLTVQGWLLYTHHYCSRFNDSSFFHSFLLFFYLLGMAASVVNVGVDTTSEFSEALMLERIVLIIMFVQLGWTVRRARDMTTCLSCLIFASLVLFVLAIAWPEYALYFWILAVCSDFMLEPTFAFILAGPRLVPVNIEHDKDRLGVLVLIMMGETAISATIDYREIQDEIPENESQFSFYVTLGWSFLLIFAFTLLYFNMQPPLHFHALRRSRFTGASVMVISKFLGLCLLSIGVSIKLIINDFVGAADPAVEDFNKKLLSYSIGASLVCLLLDRACHYFGRYPRDFDPPRIQAIMWLWWGSFATFCIIPFIGFVYISTARTLLAVVTIWVLLVCLVDSSFTHFLEDYLPDSEEEQQEANNESQVLIDDQQTPTSYQSHEIS